MRHAVPSRMRSIAAGEGPPSSLTLRRAGHPAWRPCSARLAATPELPRPPSLARVTSSFAYARSHLALVSLRTAQRPSATAPAAEPVYAERAEARPPSPRAAAPGNGAHGQPEQAAPPAAGQQHVVVNFYHLTDVVDPEKVLPQP